MSKILIFFFCGCLLAQGAFFKTRIGDLRVDEEFRPLLAGRLVVSDWQGGRRSTIPIARFENFAFVVPEPGDEQEPWSRRGPSGGQAGPLSEALVVFEMKDGAGRKGFLDVSQPGSGPMQWKTIPCEIDPARLKACDAEESRMFLDWHDRHHLAMGSQGGLWYRGRSNPSMRERRDFDFDRTFTTMSGGRALAENLALDRDLILGIGKDGEEVALSEIRGVTVAPIPWEERMPEGEIVVDELSKRIPEDQHVMIVPSLKDFFALMDRLEKTGTPILQSFATGEEYRGLPSRYRRQMGLDLPESLARFLPIGSVAVTGGDPFFPTGSDVAVLLETDKVDFVYAAIQKTVAAKARLAGAVALGESGFENPDRSFSSHVAKLEGAVVVSNSARQIARLQEVADGPSRALGSTDEYRFFRHRYPVGKGESAYVFISDACLRRWSGPEVRIGASRRNRAMAALARVTAGSLMTGELDPQFDDLLGTVSRVDGRVVSENYGSLGFVTPIGELGIKTVSAMEKAAYERWRRGYENGWARFFDPIAMQFRLSKDREGLDMTILPLRVDSDYDDMIALAGDSVLSKAAQTLPAGSAFHFAMAIDKESELFKQGGISLVDLLPSLSVNPLGWVGQSVSVTLGDDLVWKSDLDEEGLVEMPVLARIEVASRLKLALFMTALKGAVEGAGPGLVDWETRTHGERKYVAMIANEEEIGSAISIYYATLPTALLVSLNEEMLKRAIDREGDLKRDEKGEGQVMAKTNPDFISTLGGMGSQMSLAGKRRLRSYQALPILNEWYKSRKTADPVAFHRHHFAGTIACPGGQGYRWNEEDLTMESVAYGHPGRARKEAKLPEILERFQSIGMVGSFEEGGLRIQIALDAEPLPPEADLGGAPRPEDDDSVVKYQELLPAAPGARLKFEYRTAGPGFEQPEVERCVVDWGRKETAQGLIQIEESWTNIFDGEDHEDEESRTTYRYELGPTGLQFLGSTGDELIVVDRKTDEFPAELWPGQIYRIRKNETLVIDGKMVPLLSAGTVAVKGWEVITGPGGEKVKALRIERKVTSLTGRDFEQMTTIEWHARGMGLVQQESRNSREKTTGRLVEFGKLQSGK